MAIDGITKLCKLTWLVTSVLVLDIWHRQKVITFSAAQMSSAFKVSTSASGSRVCSADKPATTLFSVRTVIECSTSCTSVQSTAQQATGCIHFNYWPPALGGSVGRCDLFRSLPKCYAVFPGCNHYKLFFLMRPCVLFLTPTAENCYTSVQPTRALLPVSATLDVYVTTEAGSRAHQPVRLAWSNYVQGFGSSSVDGNFWLGLENMYQLTNAPGADYRLRIEMMAAADGKWFSIEYDSFYIESAATKYTLRVASGGSGVVGDAGDALNDPSSSGKVLANGMPFSAKDNDNDRTSSNCAQIYGGGWWYNACMWCNLNGDLPGDNHYWHSLTSLGLSSSWSLQISRMMIAAI